METDKPKCERTLNTSPCPFKTPDCYHCLVPSARVKWENENSKPDLIPTKYNY